MQPAETSYTTATIASTPPANLDVSQTCKAAGDPLRSSILKLLGTSSFGVLELCELFDMAQPAMSHHLKNLVEAGLVEKRPEGTFVFYQRNSRPTEFTQSVYRALDAETIPTELLDRMKLVYQSRARRSQAFFASNASALKQQHTLVCQDDVYTPAVVTTCESRLPEQRGRLLEVGPGDGALLVQLATIFEQVHAIDTSPINLDSTQRATAELANVKLEEADFFTLPASNRYHAIVAAMVIHHLAAPAQFFSRAREHLLPGGLLLVVELAKHSQQWVTEACGDVWLGFETEELIQWADQASFTSENLQHLAQRNGFNVQVHTFQLNSE